MKLFSRKNVQIAIVAVLVLLAILLGSKILIENQSKTSQGTLNNSSTPTSSPEQEVSVPNKIPSIDADLTDEERTVLNVPVNGTMEEKQTHYKLALKLAKEAEFLDVAECHIRPVVLKIGQKEKLKVRNNDSESHFVVLSKDDIYEIPANKTKEIEVDFTNRIGLHGYACDASPTTSGLFIVE